MPVAHTSLTISLSFCSCLHLACFSQAWLNKAPLAVYTDDEFIGDDVAFIAWLRKNHIAFDRSRDTAAYHVTQLLDHVTQGMITPS